MQKPMIKGPRVHAALAISGVLLLSVVLLASLVAPASAHGSFKPTLTGTVTGDGGNPLRGVHIQVVSDGKVVARAMTNWNGQYRACVAPGTYDVTFECRNYASLTDSAVVVTAPSTTHDATLTLLPLLTGTVTDGTTPLRGVTVKVMNGSDVVGKACTNRDGVYKVYVPEGTYNVTFSRHGYNPVSDKAVPVTGPSTTLDAALTQLPVLTGTVTGAGGAPVADAFVRVMSGDTFVGCGETNSTGVYKVYVPEGTYDVRICAWTYEPFSATGIVVTAPSTTFDAALTQLPILTGTVTGDGGAVPHARVKVMSGDKFVAWGMTDENGVYKVYVPEGTYDVKICAWPYEPFSATGIVVTAPSTTFDAPLTQLPILTGTVTGDGGAVLPHARVKVMSGGKCVASAITDENGVYTVYVVEGTYDVTFCARGYQPLTDKGVVTTAPSTTLDAALTLAPVPAPCKTGARH